MPPRAMAPLLGVIAILLAPPSPSLKAYSTRSGEIDVFVQVDPADNRGPGDDVTISWDASMEAQCDDAQITYVEVDGSDGYDDYDYTNSSSGWFTDTPPSSDSDDITYDVYVSGEECLDGDPYYPDGDGEDTSYAEPPYPDSMYIESYSYMNDQQRAQFASDNGYSPVPLFVRINSDQVIDQWGNNYSDSVGMWEDMTGDYSACLSGFDSTPESDPVPGPSWDDYFWGSATSCYQSPPVECDFEMYDTWVASNGDGDYYLSPNWTLDYSCFDVSIS